MTLLSLVCQKYVQKFLHFKSNPDYNILFRKKKMAMNRRKGNRDKRTSPGEQTMTKGVFFFLKTRWKLDLQFSSDRSRC